MSEDFKNRIEWRLDKSGECWLWTGGKTGGRGHFKLCGKKTDPRRASYEAEFGPLARSARLKSLCGHLLCCRPSHSITAPKDPPQKFLAKTEVVDGHRLWRGRKLPNGYGQYYFEGRWQGAHRVAYRLTHGEIPIGFYVRQSCKDRLCVDDRHLIATPAIGPFGLKYKIPTAEEVALIRQRLKAPGNYEQIGAEFGVTGSHVSRIDRGTYRIGREKSGLL